MFSQRFFATLSAQFSLAGTGAKPGEQPAEPAREISAQYRANRTGLEAVLIEERRWLVRSRHDPASFGQSRAKSVETLYRPSRRLARGSHA